MVGGWPLHDTVSLLLARRLSGIGQLRWYPVDTSHPDPVSLPRQSLNTRRLPLSTSVKAFAVKVAMSTSATQPVLRIAIGK